MTQKHPSDAFLRALHTFITDIEQKLVRFFASFPHLPERARAFLVKIAPWLSLVFGILAIIALVNVGILSGLFSPFLSLVHGGMFIGILVFLSVFIGMVSAVLQVLAFQPLQTGKKKGWDYLFLSALLGIFVACLNILFMAHQIGDFFFSLIGLWILFEIRSYYTH